MSFWKPKLIRAENYAPFSDDELRLWSQQGSVVEQPEVMAGRLFMTVARLLEERAALIDIRSKLTDSCNASSSKLEECTAAIRTSAALIVKTSRERDAYRMACMNVLQMLEADMASAARECLKLVLEEA